MSIRFRRSIRICKGLRVNLNKDSVGLSVGPRGLGYTVNSNGRKTVHAGIPGTGLSYVSSNNVGSSKALQSPRNVGETSSNKKMVDLEVHFELGDDGKWRFYYPNGKEIFDPSLINKIKKLPAFIEQKNRILTNRNARVSEEVDDYNSGIEELINIHKMSAYPILEECEYVKALEQIKLKTYEEEEYKIPKPTIESITQLLIEEADQNIKSAKFWSIKKKKNEYVQSNLNQRFENATKIWETNKQVFDKSEKEKSINLNKEYKQEYDEAIERSKRIINGDEETINDEIELFLCNIKLPLEFNVNFSYTKSNDSLLIDLDLPEIEDMPSETATQLSNGIKKMIPKTKQAIKDDYKQFVFGFALFLTSHLFNISPKIETIIISGYTQRRDKNDEIKDDYIYSIIFDRNTFKKYNPLEENSIYICNRFKNRCNIDMYSNFKTIEPYTLVEG